MARRGTRFGDPGFYRLDARGPGRVRVWHIRSLKERFDVFVDDVNGSIQLFYDRAPDPVFYKDSLRTKSANLRTMGVKFGVYTSDNSAPCTSYFDNVTIDVIP